MTIAQYLPQWLRRKPNQPARQKVKPLSKKDRQVLPTVAQSKRPAMPFRNDDSPAGYHLLWRI